MAVGAFALSVRVLIVKLSSLGDVVHAMPVVHDILAARPDARIDWVVDPGFAPLVQRIDGIGEVIPCALRRWTKAWWTGTTRREWRGFRQQLRQRRYDVVLDLQGLTKSAVIARLAHGVSYGLANRTEGASHEPPARWLVDHPIRIEPHVHAVDRSRQLAARALGHAIDGPPVFGLRARHMEGDDAAGASNRRPLLVLVHGSSRADKLWPEAAWIALGQRAVAEGWRIALPRADAAELARAERLRAALGDAAEVWPAMPLDALVDRLGLAQGVIGVDSGLSHIAVALDLPHVQIYNFPTAWRTGPQPGDKPSDERGHRQLRQVSVEARPTPTLDQVWSAWQRVRPPAV